MAALTIDIGIFCIWGNIGFPRSRADRSVLDKYVTLWFSEKTDHYALWSNLGRMDS